MLLKKRFLTLHNIYSLHSPVLFLDADCADHAHCADYLDDHNNFAGHAILDVQVIAQLNVIRKPKLTKIVE